jgi:hypothetical protein
MPPFHFNPFALKIGLITRSATVDESLIQHVLGGGGSMGGRVGSGRPSLAGVTSLQLEIDMLLFSDGEIAGPDSEKFAAELQSRKPAAEFVAKQIQLAQADGRDVTLWSQPLRTCRAWVVWAKHRATR